MTWKPQPRPALLRSAAVWIVWTLAAPAGYAASESVTGASGLTAAIDPQSGRYEVRSEEAGWTFAGRLGGAASNVVARDGSDRLGAFRELSFHWKDRVALTGSIRAYIDHPALLFSITSDEPVPNSAVMRFPRFTELPKNLHHFSYASEAFAPASFALEENGSPWLLYDDRPYATILSPAANFMIASMWGNGRSEIASGFNRSVAALPAGFTHSTLMALSHGVNAAWQTWGSALTALLGTHRPGNDADIGLRYLGYWTDNGAQYYYDYDRQLGYAGTLKEVVRRYRDEGIPIRYLQLDSWWYYKTLTEPTGKTGRAKNPELPEGEWNRYGGLLKYEPHPAVFPEGLAAFDKEVGLPLIVHNRWIDPASPYHERYRISGFAAVDPAWWTDIIGHLVPANVVTYEQDWLNIIYRHSPELGSIPGVGDAFADGMANATREKGLTVQYCMALPREFLEGARYDNVTTIRVSGDRFGRDKWDTFLYTSRLASALGIWPWADVFMSSETDNLLLATLSAGMVGVGDRMGSENRSNLLRAVRSDGVIVKPDTPLVPLDSMYTAGSGAPMLAAARSAHGALTSSYVFSYARSARSSRVSFTPTAVGVAQDAYVYDERARTARRLGATEPFEFTLPGGASAYFIVVPVARVGLAFFGDSERFVPDGRKRISDLKDEAQQLTATVVFSANEKSLRLFGYAPRPPSVTARSGTVGEVSFDRPSGRFEFEVSPASASHVEQPGNDPVLEATLSLELK